MNTDWKYYSLISSVVSCLLIPHLITCSDTHIHNRYNSPGREIAWSHRPLPAQSNIYKRQISMTPAERELRNPNKLKAADLRFSPHGQWDWSHFCLMWLYNMKNWFLKVTISLICLDCNSSHLIKAFLMQAA
jgi:hypothetical protein